MIYFSLFLATHSFFLIVVLFGIPFSVIGMEGGWWGGVKYGHVVRLGLILAKQRNLQRDGLCSDFASDSKNIHDSAWYCQPNR